MRAILPAIAVALCIVPILTTPGTGQEEVKLEKVATGFGFVEGPAWNALDNRLLFSDIRNNKILQLGAKDKITTFLDPSERANGLMFDSGGDLYACLGGARQVVRIDPEGKRTVLADSYGGKKLNSPNDLALDDEGGLYFTDPRYGKVDDVEQDVMGVYYVAADGKVTRVISELRRPNGIVVSRDGGGLYVAEPDKREIHYYPILAPGRLGKGRMIFQSDRAVDGGGPDGMAVDEKGNIYATYKNLLVIDPGGKLLRRIPVPEKPANVAFGGEDLKTLYVTARTSLYRMKMDVRGAVNFFRPPLVPRGRFRLPVFETVDVDKKVGIGYGVAIAEINGDGKPDIVLVDRDYVAWYQNPGWEKHVIARTLTKQDHVCVAARDINNDGKAEIAIGAGWNPSDTVKSGSVHFLTQPVDRTQLWRPRALHHEPTVHRMHWIRDTTGFALIVAPLHGRGNKAGRGKGAKLLLYRAPDDPENDWRTELIDETLHVSHNFDPVQWDDDVEEEILVAAREGIFLFDRAGRGFRKTQLVGQEAGDESFRGASEVRLGRHPRLGTRFLVTVEPFHGNQLVLYTPNETYSPRSFWRRRVLRSDLRQGHALACADFKGEGSNQIVIGWRGKNAQKKIGIEILDPHDSSFRTSSIVTVDNEIACEDLRVADLDGDGRLDIVAAGRATHNLRIYFNRTERIEKK